jgi:signal transduction histidine kinase
MGLRPGDYRFEVIAANHHGVWQEKGASAVFRLNPFFYQTWWFYLVFGASTAGILTMIIRWRLHVVRMIHRLEKAEALNDQRKQIARDIHDELGASLTQILKLSEEAQKNSGQPGHVKAQNRRISCVAGLAVDSIGEIVWVNNPEYDTLEDLVAYLREYIANLFADTNVRVKFQFPDAIPRCSVTGLFRRHVLLLVKEALQNVMKHARARLVEVRLAVRNKELALCVADDGCGSPLGNAAPSGNGVSNMKNRVAELRGSFDFKSAAGQGTEVSFLIPLQ